LVGRAREGDEVALHTLLKRYLPRLKHWAAGRLPHHARDLLDTDDLVQEAVIRSIRRLDTFEQRESASFLSYMRRAILNRIGDEVRRAKRKETKEAFIRDELPTPASPLQEAIGSETIERYERALAQLDPEIQDAVVARLEFGFSYAEIAEATGKSTADAARMTVNRAIRRLAEQMREVRDDAP
jgi:RNA polymerase sigma-70 factor (ECF subfamily)